MKTRLFGLALVVVLTVLAMTGCQAAKKVQSAGNAAERSVESVGDTLKQKTDTTTATAAGKHTNPVLSLEEAQKIALKHAGLSADEVTGLHTEFEIERGIPQYDVEFHHGTWEYDYEIHADTGEIISFSKDE